MVMNDLVASVKATGGLGVIGVYVPEDPQGPNKLAKAGKIPFDFGELWSKAQTIGTGQAPVKRYNRCLMNLIQMGKAKPSWIVSHELPLDRAPDAYKHFDDRDEGWTKVVLRPELTVARTRRASNGGGIVGAIGRVRAAHASRQQITSPK
jgi:glutathione-independent formaldehyde dehydrogenase